jgi:hypothetical protein
MSICFSAPAGIENLGANRVLGCRWMKIRQILLYTIAWCIAAEIIPLGGTQSDAEAEGDSRTRFLWFLWGCFGAFSGFGPFRQRRPEPNKTESFQRELSNGIQSAVFKLNKLMLILLGS